ncbi:hypothetical protein BC827DRAFT_725303 [Russula dissimulans]|nr:hypothetical protein BC827DRAFT_725303 [Russula dissimulans]
MARGGARPPYSVRCYIPRTTTHRSATRRPTHAARAPPRMTTQLLSRLLDALRAALPRLPDTPALTALLTQLTYCATSFARLGFDFRTLLPPLFEDAVRTRTRVSGEFVRAAEEFGCTPPTGWAAAGAPRKDSRGGAAATAGVLHMPPQGLAVYPPLAVFANALLAALNGLRLLAPVALLGDFTNALDASLAKGCDTLLAAPREEARGAATVFVRLLVPFVRRGLIEDFTFHRGLSKKGKNQDNRRPRVYVPFNVSQ